MSALVKNSSVVWQLRVILLNLYFLISCVFFMETRLVRLVTLFSTCLLILWNNFLVNDFEEWMRSHTNSLGPSFQQCWHRTKAASFWFHNISFNNGVFILSEITFRSECCITCHVKHLPQCHDLHFCQKLRPGKAASVMWLCHH